MEVEMENSTSQNEVVQKNLLRSLVAYWFLGVCNNYGYVVMLSAANDILHQQTELMTETKNITNSTASSERGCNYISTGVILLADIIPSLIIKLLSPFLPFFVNVRVAICIFLACSGYILVAFSTKQWMSILGVIVTSLCSGLGEVTFLQYSSFFPKNVISTWSSGTGGAGIIGAFSYAVLNALGLRTALLIMLIVPVTMGIAFWLILPKPSNNILPVIDQPGRHILVFKEKLLLLPGLMQYMIPLALVYLFVYFINQGMFELINFENTFTNKAQQYRWLQVDYQIGVFLSRSSVNIIHIRNIWILSALQFFNVILFTTEVIFYYIPRFWIISALTFWEGLLSGGAYVNTFYKISTNTTEDHKEFYLGMTSFADSLGVTLAGICAIVAHNNICDLPKPQRLSI